MDSYQQLQSRAPYKSPAKEFARLKSKVRREAMNEASSTEKHAGVFNETPRKRTENHRTAEDLRQLKRTGNGEVTAVTISPIASPQKNMGYTYSTNWQLGHSFKRTNAHMPIERSFWESTAVEQSPNVVTTSHQSQLDRFHVTVVESDDPRIHCDPGVFEEDSHLHATSSDFSPMRNRLRTRKLDLEMNKVSRLDGIDEGTYVQCQTKERKPRRFFSEDDYFSSTRDVGACLPPQEPMMAPPAKTRCKLVEALPAVHMSPAKRFAYMKARETQRVKTEVPSICSSPRRQADWDNQSEFSAKSDSKVSSVDGMERSEEECTDSQFDRDPSEPVSVAPSQPSLLDDPVLLNSPSVSIPRKQEAVFKHPKLPQYAAFPNTNVIYLKKWFLRKNHKGLFVDGINRENNIPWNSNIITDRVSNRVLKTVSGRVYNLVGNMNLDAHTEFPKWFLKSYAKGFPSNWKELYETYLSKGNLNRAKETQNKITKTTSMNLSAKRHRQSSSKTPESCPSSTVASTRVSRSGRLIKPPLEYWKGGRVVLDADMNATIHECYGTSVSLPVSTTSIETMILSKKSVGYNCSLMLQQVTATTEAAQTSAVVPLNEGTVIQNLTYNIRKASALLCCSLCEQQVPTANPQPSVTLRKVKTPLCKCDKTKKSTQEKPSSPPKNIPTDTVTRSSLRKPLHVQSAPKDTLAKKTKTQKNNTNSNSVKGNRCPVSTPSPPINNGSSPQASNNDEAVTFKKKRFTKKAIHKKSQVNVHSRLRSSSPSSNSSDEREKEMQKSQKMLTKNMVKTQTNHKRSTKTPLPSKPAQKTTQSTKTSEEATSNTDLPQEQDEDEWTEAELKRLHEAVRYYPLHISGYWTKVAEMVGTHSAEECFKQHWGTVKTPAKHKKTKKKAPSPKDEGVAHPGISAHVGTLRRKQQVRKFLEAMPKEEMDDVFSSAEMQRRRFELPSICSSDDENFSMSDQEPLTPRSTGFPEAKTPQCLHISPGMMGSTSRNHDKYVFPLQKMKSVSVQLQRYAPLKQSKKQ